MEWRSEYESGDEELDGEHRALVEAISILERSLNERASPQQIQGAIGRLGNYLRAHFVVEERRMREARYPDINRHIKEHRDFLERLEELQRKSFTPASFDRAMASVVTWTARHIVKFDHAMARHSLGGAENGAKRRRRSA